MNQKKEAQNECKNLEAHEAHMSLNGECPWCGAYDPEAIDPTARVEDFG